MWRLPKALIPIFGTTLVDTLGYTLMIPLLPVVVRDYHVPTSLVGAMLSIPAICSMIAAPIWGKTSDVIGRKPIVVISQVLSLVGYLMLAFSHTAFWLFLSRIISGCGGGSLGAVQSYIADVTGEEERDRAYSLYGAVFGMAFVVGPVLSGMLMKHGISMPFFVASGLEAVNIVFAIAFLPRTKPKKTERTSVAESLQAANVPGVRMVLVRQFLAILAIVCFLANFSLYLQDVLHEGVANAGWLLAMAGVVGGAVLVFLVSPMAARFGDKRVAEIGLALSVVAYLLLAFVQNVASFCVALVLWAVGSAMVEPTLTALLSVRAKEKERGAIMGLGDSINSLAMIIGPAAGSAIVAHDARMLGAFPAAAAGIAVALGWFSKGKDSKKA